MNALFLGIDVGTTTLKSVLFDEHGREIRLASRSMEPQTYANGQATQNMEQIWDRVAEVIRETIAGTESYGELAALGVTGMGDGLWLVDKRGRPVADAVLWTDGRAVDYINKWKREDVIRSSGRAVFSGSPLPLSAWAYDHNPQLMQQADRLMFCKDWIKYCLTGEIVTEPTDLSDASLINVWIRTYSEDLLAKFGVPQLLDLLPPIRPCTEIIGRVTRSAAEKTGLPEGLPVVNGMIDVVASALGNGVISPMSACSVVGTTIYNEMVVDNIDNLNFSQENAPSIICYAKDNLWLLTMGTMLGTPNLDWFLREFYQDLGSPPCYAELEERMRKVGPGAGGVIYHPYLGQGGERAPFNNPSAAAQFFGLKNHHTRDHLLLAVYEGIAYSMKDCYMHFPIQPQMIRIGGGGSTSAFWRQIFADCTGLPIQVTPCNQSGAFGAAIGAAVGVGLFKNLQEATENMVCPGEIFEPDPKRARLYDDNYAIYKRLYESNWEIWDEREKLWKTS